MPTLADHAPKRLLSADGVVAGYGGKEILSGIGLHVTEGEMVAIIGHNGAGKSTLLKTIFGLVHLSQGNISLGSRRWLPNPRYLLRAGVAYVPQGNIVFPDLTVRENLRIGLMPVIEGGGDFAEGMAGVIEQFPALKEHLNQVAGTLSGGERQMVALGRALISKPNLLLLDEPSLGLASPVMKKTFAMIQKLTVDHSIGILVVEQKVREILGVANRVYVLKRGQVSFQGAAGTLLANEEMLRSAYL